MLRNLFWLVLSFVVIAICGSVVKSEASVMPVRSGPGLAQNSGSGQTGSSGGNIPLGGQNRFGAGGRASHSIPKPEEDRRGKHKGRSAKRKAKKRRKKSEKGVK